MRISFTKKTSEKYLKLPVHIKKKTDRQLKLLLKNPRHPSLRSRKMKGMDKYEVRIDYQYRFTYLIDGDNIVILTIGPHDEGLGKN